MIPLTISSGRGRAQGDTATTADVSTLAKLLDDHSEPDAWVCGGVFGDCYRDNEHWQGAQVVFVDWDTDPHKDLLTDEQRNAAGFALLTEAVGNLHYFTRRGGRAVFVLDELIDDVERITAVLRKCGEIVAHALRGVPGVKVDPSSFRRSQFYWAPNTVADGVERRAKVEVLQHDPFSADWILRWRAVEVTIGDLAEQSRQEPKANRTEERGELGCAAVEPAAIDELDGFTGESKLDAVRDALRYVCPDDRPTWFGVACVLYHEFGEDGFDAFDEYSARGYDYGKVREKWASVDRKEGAKKPVAWLFATARAAGWTGSGYFSAEGLAGIEVRSGFLLETTQKAEDALLGARWLPTVYQRDGELVRIASSPECEALREGASIAAEVPQIVPVEPTWLRAQFERAAVFHRHDARSKKLVRTSCPADVASLYAQSRGSWRVPRLTATVQIPTLRPDGSVLQTPGYDKSTGILYDPGGAVFPVVPDAPTLEDAKKALGVLLEPVRLFPWADRHDCSVWLAAALTPFVRPALPTAPMCLFDGPTRGTGKTKLATVITTVASGTEPSVLIPVESDAEQRKRLFALLRRGVNSVLIDNIDRPLEGASLCAALTTPVIEERVLGESLSATVRTAATFLGTGNNVTVRGDLTRRVLVCRLDPHVERPEERSFDFNPVALAKSKRPELVAAALTILRAHVVAGAPAADGPAFGSFEEWSNRVRSAVTWLGEPDPILGRTLADDSDDEHAALVAFLHCWRDKLGDQWVPMHEAAAALPDAVAEFVSDIEPRNRLRVLGRRLGAERGRIIDGLRIERGERRRAGGFRWRVES